MHDVTRASTTRELIVCVAEPAGDAAVFLRRPWSDRWSRIWREPAEALAGSIGPHLRLRPGMAVPQFEGGRPALWLTELDQLETALGDPTWATIVFQPSAAAALDAMRMQRGALAASRPLAAGHVLTRDDVAVVRGGLGVPEAALDKVIGRALCYDLNADEPITFGMIEIGEDTGGSALFRPATPNREGRE
jgi:hypothetical protein